jgi:hypothetical protein
MADFDWSKAAEAASSLKDAWYSVKTPMPTQTSTPAPSGSTNINPPKKEGLSTGAVVAISLGGVILLGSIIFIAVKLSK